MKRKKICILLIVAIIVFLEVIFSKRVNKNAEKLVIYQGTNLRVSVDGQESSILPTSGTYYLVDYSCKSSDTVLSWDSNTHQLKVSNRNKKGGVSCYLNFQSTPEISSMSVGSYVAYTGSGGTVGSTNVACQTNGSASSSTEADETEAPNSCSGQNAREDLDTSGYTYGYCHLANYKYYTTGWRIAYIDQTNSSNPKAILISAGSPECNRRTASAANVTYIQTANAKALKYCNTNYVDGNCTCTDSDADGLCDSPSTDAWAVNDTDFYYMTKAISGYGKRLARSSSGLGDRGGALGTTLYCDSSNSYQECGYNNDLIDNGGYYWFADRYTSSSTYGVYWNPIYRSVNANTYAVAFGLRPVIRLSSSVYITGGSGTYEDPYQIANNSFLINGGSSYVNASEKSVVQLNLIGTGVSQMCINVDSSGCSNYVDFATSYTLDWSDEDDGEKIVYVYYKDSGGNLVASMSKRITIDSSAPTNNSVTIGEAAGLSRTLAIFSTGADKMCFSNSSSSVNDCTSWVDYTTSYKWRLSDGTGNKTVYAFFKDKAGNVSSTTATTNVTSIVEFVVNEDFADTTYDSNITVTGGATYPWTVSNGQFQSTSQGINSSTSSSTIQFTPTVNATLSFDYGVSSEANYDKLTITLTGSDSSSSTLVSAISGTKSGSVTDVTLTSGVTYTLTLSYVKDGSGNSGSDIGYIDNLIINS